MGSTILAVGHYAPERRVGNAELEGRLGLAPGWIEQRTGILERRYAAPEEAMSDLAIKAGEMALARAGIGRHRIGLLVLATSTPDHLLPPTAPLVAEKLGLAAAGAIDMAGACSGFLYALALADSFARTQGQTVLVIAGNILSRRLNLEDRNSAAIFADAAGAVIIAPSPRREAGVLAVELASDGAAYDLIKIAAGGSRKPFSPDVDRADTLMHISDGRAVFARAVEMMADASQRALVRAGVTIGHVDHWLPHQANIRIIAAVEKKLGLAPGKLMSSVALFGNSSAGTMPLTLSLCASDRDLKAGQTILMSAAGAGLTGGALVYRL